MEQLPSTQRNQCFSCGVDFIAMVARVKLPLLLMSLADFLVGATFFIWKARIKLMMDLKCNINNSLPISFSFMISIFLGGLCALARGLFSPLLQGGKCVLAAYVKLGLTKWPNLAIVGIASGWSVGS